MKRSQFISLGLVPIVSAAFLAACDAPQQKTCVDQSGHVVADANCDSQSSAGSSGSWNDQASRGSYRWYWFSGPRIPMGGQAPFGGHYSASGGETARGGFGATAAGHASAGS